MSFGEILKLLREENEMTQEDLGKKIRVSKANISKYEKGTIEPNLATINYLAEFFNVTVDYLLGRSKIRNPYIKPIPIDEDSKKLIDYTKNLTPESKKMLDEYIKLLNMKDSIKKAEDESTPTAENA